MKDIQKKGETKTCKKQRGRQRKIDNEITETERERDKDKDRNQISLHYSFKYVYRSTVPTFTTALRSSGTSSHSGGWNSCFLWRLYCLWTCANLLQLG
jgi:hypothetical protein